MIGLHSIEEFQDKNPLTLSPPRQKSFCAGNGPVGYDSAEKHFQQEWWWNSFFIGGGGYVGEKVLI
jgi:hypothetical protein